MVSNISVGMIGICLAAPLILMMLFIKGEGRKLIFFMILGFVACLIASKVNSYYLNKYMDIEFGVYSSYYAPIVEELLKFIPVLIYSIVCRNKNGGHILVGLSVGVGFATLENTYYMITSVKQLHSLVWVLGRGFSTALMHGICTGAIAFTLSFVYKRRKFSIIGTLAAITMAMTFHSIYNIMLQSYYQTYILFLPIVTYLAAYFVINKDNIKKIKDKLINIKKKNC